MSAKQLPFVCECGVWRPEVAPKGVFWGYELHPGAKWGGDYLVAEFICIEDVDFHTARLGDKVVHIHRTKAVSVDVKDKARAPFQSKYDQTLLELRPADDRTPLRTRW